MSALDRYATTLRHIERRSAPIASDVVSDADLLFYLRFIADNERRADNRHLLRCVAQRLTELLREEA